MPEKHLAGLNCFLVLPGETYFLKEDCFALLAMTCFIQRSPVFAYPPGKQSKSLT